MNSDQVDVDRPDGDQGLQAMVAYTGQNVAMPRVQELKGGYDVVAPGLDATSSLHVEIDRHEKPSSFAYRMVGDGFPNAQAFLLDASNNLLMPATHGRTGSALHQPRGNRRTARASSVGEVNFDNDVFGSSTDMHWCLDCSSVVGTQIDVMEETGQQPTTESAWNGMHTKRDARGGTDRSTQGKIVTHAPGRAGSTMP